MTSNDYSWEHRYAEGFELCRKLGNQEALTFSRYQTFLETLYKNYPQRFKDRTILIVGMGTGEGADGEALAKASLQHAAAKEIKFIGVDIDRDYVEITAERLRHTGIANTITFQGDAFAAKTLEEVVERGNGHLPTIWQYDHVVYFVDDKPGFVKTLNSNLMPDSFVLLAHGEGTAKKLKTAFETNQNPNYELGDFYVEVDFSKILGEPMSQKHWDALLKAVPLLSENHDPYPEYLGLTHIRKIIEFRNRGPLENLDEEQRRNILEEFKAIIEDGINGKPGCYKYRNQMQVMLQTDRDQTLENKVLEAINFTRTKFDLPEEPLWQPSIEVGNGINLSPHATVHLASDNPNKAMHVRNFLRDYLVPLKTVKDNLLITGHFEFPAEKTIAQGGTCEKNSETKLLAYAQKLRDSLIEKWQKGNLTREQIDVKLQNQIVIADDSELVVEGLEWRRGSTPHPMTIEGKATHGREFPGSFTKPWVHEIASGTEVSHHEIAAAEISCLLAGQTEIPAYFRALYSVVSLANLDRVHQVSGRLEGTFIYPPKQGEHGWGFESCFVPVGRQQSLAQIPTAEKSQFNQVASALEGIMELFFKKEESVRLTEFDLRGLTAESKVSEIERLKHYIALSKVDLGIDKIGFVCGSAFANDPEVLAAAKMKGEHYGMTVTGAGSKSVMRAIADGAALPIGVTCDSIMTIEPGFREAYLQAGKDHIMVYTNNPAERLELMIKLSDVVDCEPGGIGTTEEALKGVLLGKEVLLKVPFFNDLQHFFDRMLSYGFITEEQRALIKNSNENNAVTQHSAELIPVNKGSFTADSERIVNILKAELGGKYDNIAIFPSEEAHIDRLISTHDCFVAVPGGLEATSQFFELIVQKRISNTVAQKGGVEILKNKPILLINIDGYHDPLIEMLRKFEKEGYLKPGEKIGDLITVIDVKSKDTEEEIRRSIKDKLGSELPALAQAAALRDRDVTGPAG